ncbi:hypothetical protein ILUMI_10121 [Ignelater luminosus]|uniref:DDE-1 domain-containing protein n=1 Tax=Ignelater luminosus TaxID=2038154 RepID=A0A8K0D2M8_IGNLU|nr:hypothetical protein ILUMI_10121 [Ignelater luminosus]
MKDHFLHGSVPGSIGYGAKSRWMTTKIFVKLLEHMQKHTKSSATCPIILLLDNHETHVSVDAINYARNNGIVLLSFPPHCTHKIQPVDKAVYGPFKQKCKTSFNDYVLSNPEKPITIYDIVNPFHSATRTPINLISVQIIKPTDVRPFTKAGTRKANRKSGLGKSRIYTSSPERARVEELEKSRKLKLETTGTKKKITVV